MIKLHVLIIEEFRVIRKLRLDFAGKNVAVYGPNGTGKSGVVDAIEFVLTGNISRLTGQQSFQGSSPAASTIRFGNTNALWKTAGHRIAVPEAKELVPKPTLRP